MEVVKPDQGLLSDFSAEIDRYSFVVVLFDDFEQVDPQNLEDHAEMISVRPLVYKGVEKLDHVTVIPGDLACDSVLFSQPLLPLGRGTVLGGLLKKLDLVISSLQVVRGTFLHLDSYVGPKFEITGQPDCGEVAPTQLLDCDIPVNQQLTNVDRVVAPLLVVIYPLIIRISPSLIHNIEREVEVLLNFFLWGVHFRVESSHLFSSLDF